MSSTAFTIIAVKKIIDLPLETSDINTALQAAGITGTIRRPDPDRLHPDDLSQQMVQYNADRQTIDETMAMISTRPHYNCMVHLEIDPAELPDKDDIFEAPDGLQYEVHSTPNNDHVMLRSISPPAAPRQIQVGDTWNIVP